MAAPYRLIQTDFSGGEIDPLAAINVNLSLKSSGVKRSVNTLHLSNGTVRKRPSSFIVSSECDGIGSGDIENKVEVAMPTATVNVLFLKGGDLLCCVLRRADGTRADGDEPMLTQRVTLPYAHDRAKSHFSVQYSRFCTRSH